MKKSIKIALCLIAIGSILALAGYAFGGARSITISDLGIHVSDY